MPATPVPAILTLETVRADIARIIGEAPEEIGDDDSLIDLGLDSIRAMTLVQKWQEQGVALDFAQLAEKPVLSHWWALIARAQAQAS